MHILFLTDNFPPEVNAPASRTFEHCREWVRAGHRITVITCAPNFPRGKVFDGYRNRLWQSEEMGGMRVIRVWSYITANEGFRKRIMDYMSFMVSGFLASLFVRRVDVIVGTSPQFFTACAAYMSGLFKRRPYVFELRDLWPESIRAVGAMDGESKSFKALERLELFLYRKAAAVVSVTRSFKRNLVDRGIEGEKIAVITNGVDISRFHPMDKDPQLVEQYGLGGKFVAGYIGTHGMAHGLDTLLEAAERLRDKCLEDRFSLILLGDGARKAELQEKAEDMGLKNVLFIDSVPKEEVPHYWSLLDASIIHLKKTDLFKTVIPSKLFECMGMGIPILHGVAGESAEIVEQEGVGLVFEPENGEALCDALISLAGDTKRLQQLRENCLAAAHQYDRKQKAKEMEKVLQQVADNGCLQVGLENSG